MAGLPGQCNMSRNAGHHAFNFLQFTLLEHVVLVWQYIVAADLKQVPCSFLDPSETN